MQDKYGFVYIWYDRKRKMYYIGSHWGYENDGYICSSNRMRDAHRRRPEDFKRRVLSRVYSERLSLLAEEQRWFDMVKDRSRYYNLNWEVRNDLWWTDPDQRLTVGQKISKSLTGRIVSDDTRQKMSESFSGRKISDEHKSQIGKSKIGNSYRKGMITKEETKKKMSIAAQGRIISEDQKKKLSCAKMGNSNRAKTYDFISPDGILTSITNLKEYCRDNGLDYGCMKKVHSGDPKRKTHKGWKQG